MALVGYGLAGAVFHAPLIAAVDGLSLSAIVTRDPERREQASRVHPGAALLNSTDEVWERSGDFDLVVVAAPNRAHVPLASAAIEAGLPVVVDKPLAPDAEQARNLVGLARERGVMLTVFQNRRWDGDFLTVRELLSDRALGRVVRFEARFDRWRPQVGEGWREADDPDEGGGLLLDLGSHLVDQALQLFGPVEDLHAELDVRRPGARVEDDTFLALHHRSGERSHLWASVLAAQLGPRMRVLGDAAAYVKFGLDPQEAALREGGSPADPGWGNEPEECYGLLGAGDAVAPLPTVAGAYQRFYEGVEAALRDGTPPPVDPDDAVAVLELLDAARAQGRPA